MNRFTELFFPLGETEDRMGEGGLLTSLLWVLEPASIPRHGDCPLALLGTVISWKAFQLMQFYTEQLLGTAGPAPLLSVRNQVANVSVLGFLKGPCDLIIQHNTKILASLIVCQVDPGKAYFVLFFVNLRDIQNLFESFGNPRT